MSVGPKEILNRFGYHAGDNVTSHRHEQVRKAFIEFAKILDEIVPDGSAKDTAFDKLQESSMWSNFGIAELAPVVSPKLYKATSVNNPTVVYDETP